MKTMKRMAGVLLALVMALALTVPAFAAPTDTTITAPAGSTRTYDVYQIFVGDLSGKVLSNVKWGKNGTKTGGTSVDQTVLDALTAVNSKSETEKLDEIEKYVNFESAAFGTVSDGHPLTAPTGYYLIKDKGPVGDGETYSLFVVQVVGPTTISPKTGTTTSEKKVQDTNDSTGETSNLQDSADYDVGDKVPFQLKGVVASDYDRYTTYKFVFHDKESNGLSFDASTVVVKVDGNKIESGYTVVTEGLDDRCTFEVQFDNLKTITSVHAGSVITVDYKSTLNVNAVVGSAGNTNSMHLEYSNNPNKSEEGDTDNTGKTPEDTVVVFTYKTIINKVDGENKALTGAAFKLEKKIKGAAGAEDTWTPVKEFTVDEANPLSSFEFSGLDDGTYKLTETVTPAGYNTIDPITFEIKATHTDGDNSELTVLQGDKVVGEIAFTPNLTAGSLSADVVNNAGAVLPETGGMGTTLFYILGSVLALGAGVLLVVKKRMGADK